MTIRITRDLLADERMDNSGTIIERKPLFPIEALVDFGDHALPTKYPDVPFRMYDDDGELYYEGVLTDDPECENQVAALRWGEVDSGCTRIEVLRDGTWVQEIG